MWARLPHTFHARESSDIIAKPLEYQVFKNTHSLCFRALQKRVFQHKLPTASWYVIEHYFYLDTGCFHEWVQSGWEHGNPFPPAASALLGHVPNHREGGMQCYEEGECPPLSCLAVGTSLPVCPHPESSSSGKPLSILPRCCSRRQWENSLKLPHLTPF